MTKIPGILVAAFCALTSVRAIAQDGKDADEGHIGQYFCYVEHTAGIAKSAEHPTFSGRIKIPDEDMKFFVRIKRIELSPIVRQLCAKTAGAFQKAFQDGTELSRFAGSLYGTGNFAEVCLKKYVAEIPGKDSKPPWKY